MTFEDDLLHYSNMITGCESINNVLTNGGKLSYEGRYAQSVLRLHAQDAGFVAGNEGFMDSIKKGASNVKEWIMKILKAIKDWLAGAFKYCMDMVKRHLGDPNHDVNEVASTTLVNPLKNLKRVYEEFTNGNKEKYITSNTILITIDKIDKVVRELEKDGGAKGSVIWPNVQTILQHIDEDVKDLARKADSAARNLPPIDREDYNAMSKDAQTVSYMCKELASAANSFTSAIMRMKDKVAAKKVDTTDLPPFVKKAIEAGNNNRILSALTTCIDDSQYTPEKLGKIISTVEKAVPDLYKEFEETNLSKALAPKSEWSPETYDTQSAYFTMNPSKQRLHHLRDMRNYLREKKEKGFH